MENESNILYRKRRRSVLRRKLMLAAAFLCLLAAPIALSVNLRPAMAAQAEARIRSVCLYAMNDAVLEVMDADAGYGELVQIRENGDHVYLLQANAQQMNLLASNCANAAQERISQLGAQGISVPLGTITGLSFLSGKGPNIRVSFTPVGSVQSEFHSEFIAAGINQTLYRVNLGLTSSVKLILPGHSETVRVSMEASICESILVGEVPQVYTDVAGEEDMMNLIPTELP